MAETGKPAKPVIVVGGGPVGLTTALGLGFYGLPFQLFEEDAALSNDTKAGTILTRGTPVYDLVRGEVLKASASQPLIIPEGAVVVPGSRSVKRGAAGQDYAADWGLSLYTPVIVKYRDEKTELSSALEELLR